MGTTGTWAVLACDVSSSPISPDLRSKRSDGQAGKGWSFYELAGRWYPSDLERYVSQWSREIDSAAFGFHVADSDFAFVVGGNKGLREFRLLINPAVAHMYSAGMDAQQLLLEDGLPLNEKGFRGLVEWSRLAPASITEARAREILEKDWTYAERAVLEILKSMELELLR